MQGLLGFLASKSFNGGGAPPPPHFALDRPTCPDSLVNLNPAGTESQTEHIPDIRMARSPHAPAHVVCRDDAASRDGAARPRATSQPKSSPVVPSSGLLYALPWMSTVNLTVVANSSRGCGSQGTAKH